MSALTYINRMAMISSLHDADTGYYNRKDNNKHSKVGKKQCKSYEYFTKLGNYKTHCALSGRPKPTDVACAYYEKRNKKRK